MMEVNSKHEDKVSVKEEEEMKSTQNTHHHLKDHSISCTDT